MNDKNFDTQSESIRYNELENLKRQTSVRLEKTDDIVHVWTLISLSLHCYYLYSYRSWCERGFTGFEPHEGE